MTRRLLVLAALALAACASRQTPSDGPSAGGATAPRAAAALRQAEETGRRDPAAGLRLLVAARASADAAGVREDAQKLQVALVRAAVERATELRRSGQLAASIELLAAAAEADGAVRPRLDAARSDLAREREEEADRRDREGDVSLRERRWDEAQAAFEAADRLRPSRRSATLARYAAAMRAADDAVQGRDWPLAARSYEAAVELGIDPRNVAARELEAVRVRTLTVQVKDLLVRPMAPDGRPWAGERTRAFDEAMGGVRAVDQTFDSEDARAIRAARGIASAVPAENAPTLSIVAELGGRRVATAPRRGLHLAPGAAIVVSANLRDDRVLSLRVMQRDAGRPREVGFVQVPLADLVAQKQAVLRQGGIARLEVVAAATDAPEGAISGFLPEALASE